MDRSPIYPLDQFYQLLARKLPEIDIVTSEEIPQPQRLILVPDNDMTPTIEAFCREKVQLQVAHKFLDEDSLYRQVVLITANSGKTMVFGAIRIYLSALPPAAQKAVLGCQQPLGSILQQWNVVHQSHPQRFFKVTSDDLIGEALQVDSGYELYGRVNMIQTTNHRKIVEVVEILPPLKAPYDGEKID